jgi:hypothetical protein
MERGSCWAGMGRTVPFKDPPGHPPYILKEKDSAFRTNRIEKLLFLRKFYLRESTSLKSCERKGFKDPPHVDDSCGPNSIVYITNPITRRILE